MPYFKVPVTMQITGYRYVEADDKDDAITRAVDACDNTLPAMRQWEEDGEVEATEDHEEVHEIDFEEYEENSSDI